MASSDKTAYLALSKWRSTDKPKRIDFVNDNEIIDSSLGGHIGNSDLHLSAERLLQLDSPIEVKVVAGTGGTSRSNVMSFSPRAVLVFAVGKAPVEISGTTIKAYSAFAAPNQCSAGLLLDGDEVRIYQNTSGATHYCLNESGVSYVIIAFR